MILPPGRWELMLLQRGFNVPRFESVTRNHTMVGAVQAVRECFSFRPSQVGGRTEDPQPHLTSLAVNLHLLCHLFCGAVSYRCPLSYFCSIR